MAKDKRLPIEGNIPDWSTPWDNGTSAYTTEQIEDFLKAEHAEMQRSKMGILHQDGDKVLVFADADSRDQYLSDRVTNAALLLGAFDAPAEFKAQITMLTEQAVTILKGDSVQPIRFTFRTVNSSGQPQGENADVVISVNAAGVKKEITLRQKPDEEIIFDPSPYLGNAGTVTVTIKVTGMATLASTSAAVSYRVVDLKLTENREEFNIGAVRNPQQIMSVAYEVAGYGDKHVQWYIDGEALPEVAEDIVGTPYKECIKHLDISSLAPGAHSLQYRCYIMDNGQPLYSQTLYRTFFVEGAAGVGVALELPTGTLVTDTLTIGGLEQYVQTSLKVAAYDPANAQGVDMAVKLKSGNTTEYTANLTARPSESYDVTLTPMTSGTKTIEISCGSASMEITAEVAQTSTGLAENTLNRILMLSAQGKSNSAEDKDVWSYGGISATFEGMDWNTASGWTGDGLRLGTESAVTIGNTGMLSNATAYGKTIEMEVEMEGVTDDEAVIMNMTSGGVGLLLTASAMRLTSAQGAKLEVRFAQGKTWRLGLVIERPTSQGGLATIYVNGIASGAVNFSPSDSFGSALMRFQGSDGATPVIKSVWVYGVALDKDSMLDNFILTRPTSQEMIETFTRNNIRDAYDPTKLDPDKVLSTGVPVVKITADLGPLQGSNRNKNLRTVRREGQTDTLEFADPVNPWRNFTIINVSIRPQGTSSMEFWIKNFRPDAKYYQDAQILDYQGNQIPRKLWPMWLNSLPVNLWCTKADYMESSGTHNTGIARLWNRVLKNARFTNAADITRFGEYPLRTRAQQHAIDNGLDLDVRTCIDGFPVVMFSRPTDNDQWSFIGKYNWNNDKSTEAVFGFLQPDGSQWPSAEGWNMQCWEVLESASDIALFKSTAGWSDIVQEGGGSSHVKWEESFEGRFPDGNTDTTQLKAFADWLVSVKNDAASFSTQKYDHMDVPKMAGYYVYLMYHGAADQTVKNSMLTTEDGSHWFAILYDNDTVHGLINSGDLILGPYITRQSLEPGKSSYAYAGHESTLWNLLEADSDFMAMVSKVAAALQGAGLTLEGMLEVFNEQQAGQWSERIYNADADLKYVQVFKNGHDNRLYALQGSRTSHRTWWLTRRCAFLDSLFLMPSFKSKSVSLRLQDGTEAGKHITVKAGAPVYLGWSVDNGSTFKQSGIYADADSAAVTFTTDTVTAYGSPIYVYGAPDLSEIDLSDMMPYIRTLSLAGCYSEDRGTRLKRLILGGAGLINTESEFNSLDFSPLTALEYLDIRGYQNLTSINITGLTKLTKLLASNTSIGAFAPERGARLNEVSLPGACSVITLRDLPRLQSSGITHANLANLRTLTVDGCPRFDAKTFVSAWLATEGVVLSECSLTLGNVAWTGVSVDTMLSLGALGTLNMTGSVMLTEAPTYDQMVRLMEIYGDDCFTTRAALRIKAPGEVILIAPTEVLEGEPINVQAVILNNEVSDCTLGFGVTSGASTGIAMASQDEVAHTMVVTTTETGAANRTVRILALAGGRSVIKDVTVKKRTYPPAYTLVGDRYVTPTEQASVEVEPTGTHDSECRVEWSLSNVVDEGEGAIADTMASALTLANMSSGGCMLRRTDGASTIGSATLTAKMYRGFDAEGSPYKTVTMRVCVHDGSIAVAKAANPEVFAICLAQGWTTHESYMTRLEAGMVTNIKEKFNNNPYIRSLNELEYFGVTSFNDRSYFNNLNNVTDISLPHGLISISYYNLQECHKLKTIKFPASLNKMEHGCLWKTNNIKSIYAYSNPVIDDNLSTCEASGVTIYLPTTYAGIETSWNTIANIKGWIVSYTL